jgi:hypothetical protein
MRVPSVASALLAAAIAMVPARSVAWGFDIHRFITDRAIDLLPDALKPFYQKYRAFIVEHSVDPDLWRTAGWAEEPPRHFMDLDVYGPPPFGALPREYDRAVQVWGREFVDRNGQLPWRTAEVYGQLERAFQQQKKNTPYAFENVKFYSAMLSHYVADGHVPFHAVMNYDGQLTGQQGIHSRWEAELAVRDLPTLTLAPAPPQPISDPRGFMFDVLLDSFQGADAILKADSLAVGGRDTYDEEYFRVLDRETRPLLERQLSRAISSVASMIYGAWDAAGRPDLPVDPPNAPKKIGGSRPPPLSKP